MPSTLKRIEYGVFEACRSLKSVTWPEKLEYIGEMSFSNCKLEEITFPASVEEIGEHAFESN